MTNKKAVFHDFGTVQVQNHICATDLNAFVKSQQV